MKTQIFCALIALSVLAVSEGKAEEMVDVECNKKDWMGRERVQGTLLTTL